MEKDLRELRVFMASPGDLADERDALRDLERRLNAMFRGRGVRVSIEGWEEVQPDAGAPQELINPLVHGCDVFVGLLNVRWGTPTDNDSSGFSEEFNIALNRRKASGTAPAIGMYFRDIDPERLRDMGPQLEAVLAFKERVQGERLVMHKAFNGADHLALEVMNFLLPHAMRLADEASSNAVDQDAGSSGSTPADDEPETLVSAETNSDVSGPQELGQPDPAQLQIVSALASFSDLFLGGASIDSGTRDRVVLAALAFAQDAGTLGAHHVNRLFNIRENLDLTLGEVKIWFRTFLENYGMADPNRRIVPMWGVIEADRGSRFISDIAEFASDGDQNVMRGTLRFMVDQRVRPELFWGVQPIDVSEDRGITDETRGRWVKLFHTFPGLDSALNYVVAVAEPNDAEFLRSVAESRLLDDRNRNLIRVVVEVITGELKSVADLAPSKYSGDDTSSVRDLVVDLIPKLSAEQWNDLLTGTHRKIAVAAALQIVEHENVSADQLTTISELGSSEVEKAILERAKHDYHWAASLVRKLTDRDKYGSDDMVSRLLAVFLPHEDLVNLDHDATLDATAWVALTIRNPEDYLESAREVLDGTSEWLSERNAPLLDKYALVAEHTAARAKGAACVVLSQASEITDPDVERVVAELRRDSYVSRPSALQALVGIAKRLDGDQERGLPDLGDISIFDSYGFVDDRYLVLESPLARIVAPVWRDSDIQALQESSLAWELGRPELSDAELEEALYLDNESLRLVALNHLMSRWNKEQLTELLSRYGSRDRQWWYNIIAALDERIYGLDRPAIDDRSVGS